MVPTAELLKLQNSLGTQSSGLDRAAHWLECWRAETACSPAARIRGMQTNQLIANREGFTSDDSDPSLEENQREIGGKGSSILYRLKIYSLLLLS